VGLVYLVTIVICLPNFVTITVKSYELSEAANVTSSSPSKDPLLVTGVGDVTMTTVSKTTDQPVLVWNVDFKVNNDFDRFMQSLNFWIQVNKKTRHLIS